MKLKKITFLFILLIVVLVFVSCDIHLYSDLKLKIFNLTSKNILKVLYSEVGMESISEIAISEGVILSGNSNSTNIAKGIYNFTIIFTDNKIMYISDLNLTKVDYYEMSIVE